MDGLPATAAIAGLLAVSGIAIDVLWDLNTSPKAATAVFNLALREVKESRSSIQALHKTLSLLESRQVPFPGRASWIEVDELVATLTDAVLAFSKLYALCSAVEAEAARSSPEEASRRYEKRMKALCARIRWHNLSIAMIMTIINWYASPNPPTPQPGNAYPNTPPNLPRGGALTSSMVNSPRNTARPKPTPKTAATNSPTA